MHYYHEAGFSFMKLGEEGIVDVKNFSLVGKQGINQSTSFIDEDKRGCRKTEIFD
jgi:phosphatidylglycerol lysyltransferase